MAARKREAAPHVQLAELERALVSEPLARIYVLRGDERYFRERAIDALCAAGESQGLEVTRHDATGHPRSAEDFELPRLMDDLSAQPMFASARLVVVRGADPLLKKSGSKDSAFTRAVLAQLADEGGETKLVIAGNSIRADNAVAKAAVKSGGRVLSLRRLYDGPPPWDPDPRKSELVLWFQTRARDERVRLSPDEALYVVTATGNDLAALETQLVRLKNSEGKSLREVVGWEGEISPFRLADQLLAGDAPRAVAGAEGLFRSGFRGRDDKREIDHAALANILLGSVSRRLRQLVGVADGVRRGENFGAAADAAGVAKGRPREELQGLFARREPTAWRGLVDDLVQLERQTRTTAPVDANHIALLALKWSRGVRDPRQGRGAAPARGRR